MTKIAITYSSDHLLEKAQKLARKLHLPLVDNNKPPNSYQYLLTITEERLELRENSTKKTKPIYVDFLSPKLDYRIQHGGKKKELIAKAIGIKGGNHPFVIDATAGFGVDSFIMASLGCKVVMLEKSPIISALLADGLKRLVRNLDLSLINHESTSYINETIQKDSEQPDVIYLDPMYPQKTKSSLNKKSMRILHDIVGSEDTSKLLNVSLKRAKNRVVVKRPKYANHLGDLKPDLELSSGRNSRYDIYLTKNKKME